MVELEKKPQCPSILIKYRLTSIAFRPCPSRKAVPSTTRTTCIVASQVVRVHTVRGTVTAIVVGVASNPEGQANA